MNVFKAIAIAACAVSFIPVEAEAQALRNAGEPAEFPPSSYTGRQYVDSNGCAFIRAGIDGNVTWVPRVTRSRELSCGFQPSLVARAPAPEPNVTVAAAPQTAQPTVRVAQAQPTAETVRVVRTTPAAQAVVPVRRVAAPTVTAPRSAPVLAAPVPVQPTVQTATRRAPAQVASANCGGSALSRQYIQSSTHSVRCGPQREDHVTRLPSAAPSSYVPRTAPAPNYAQTAQVVTPDTRIAPRHVVREQRLSTQGVSIPEGYKRVWMDGRLNPQRAHQTYAGKAQMDLMWTRTTPRRLIDRQTGQEVTALHPGLKYPYTSYAAQPEHVTQKRLAAAPEVTMSSRTLPVAAVAAAEPARAASHRFVQAGVYRTRAQAEVEARRVASMGLPARLGTMRHNGQDLTMVLAGPFNSQSALNSAMTRVRGAGFGNAVLRK